MVDIGVKSYIEKHVICLKDYRIIPFLSIRHTYGDLCEHLGIDSSTDLDDRYSNLFLNAYINPHTHTEYLKNDLIIIIIDVYIYQCAKISFNELKSKIAKLFLF